MAQRRASAFDASGMLKKSSDLPPVDRAAEEPTSVATSTSFAPRRPRGPARSRVRAFGRRTRHLGANPPRARRRRGDRGARRDVRSHRHRERHRRATRSAGGARDANARGRARRRHRVHGRRLRSTARRRGAACQTRATAGRPARALPSRGSPRHRGRRVPLRRRRRRPDQRQRRRRETHDRARSTVPDDEGSDRPTSSRPSTSSCRAGTHARIVGWEANGGFLLGSAIAPRPRRHSARCPRATRRYPSWPICSQRPSSASDWPRCGIGCPHASDAPGWSMVSLSP